MAAPKNILKSTLFDLGEYFKSTDFSKAILLGIALTLPIIAGVKLDILAIGTTITVGAMLASPSDVSGSIQHKFKGILLATLLAMIVI